MARAAARTDTGTGSGRRYELSLADTQEVRWCGAGAVRSCRNAIGLELAQNRTGILSRGPITPISTVFKAVTARLRERWAAIRYDVWARDEAALRITWSSQFAIWRPVATTKLSCDEFDKIKNTSKRLLVVVSEKLKYGASWNWKVHLGVNSKIVFSSWIVYIAMQYISKRMFSCYKFISGPHAECWNAIDSVIWTFAEPQIATKFQTALLSSFSSNHHLPTLNCTVRLQ